MAKPEPVACAGIRQRRPDQPELCLRRLGSSRVPGERASERRRLVPYERLQRPDLVRPLESDELFYLAHRIDKETSGILVLTKDAESCANVVAQFAERKTEKTYLAIMRGITPETFECHEAMNRAKGSKVALKMACMPEADGGQVAGHAFALGGGVDNSGTLTLTDTRVTDNLAITPADFNTYCVTGPKDSRRASQV